MDAINNIVSSIAGALGDGTAASVSAAQAKLDKWAATTTTTTTANQSTHLYIGKPPRKGKKPFWHSRPNIQQPHSVITSPESAESAASVTVVIFEDSYEHESVSYTHLTLPTKRIV
eukprot:TRINITY_DN64431_c0_g1_i1.p1 TRINITY_DN64431_c0_g1~~TRINITY_DN64431_c0_g1_i1.p1  ORF type:complete len:116 (+),score=22.79 TRINITY_DN64431_c0_g1_i1:78-425(+)